MEINRLKQFCAIYGTGNLRQAADLIGMTPGALSKSMKHLQSELEVALFIQSGRGLAITDEGRKLYANAQRVISEHELMLNSMKQKEQQSRPVRIASFEPFTVYFIGNLIREYFQKEQLFVLERTLGHIEEVILSRQADLGITYAPVPHAELDFLKICSFEKRIYARKGCFSGMQISEIPFAAPFTPVLGSPTGITSVDGWPDDVPRRLMYQLEMLEATLEVCRLGLAAIFAPDFVVSLQNRNLNPECRLYPVPMAKGLTPLKRIVYLVKRKSDNEDANSKKLAKALRLVCSGKD